MSQTTIPTLKFADEHVEPILAGRKTSTIRYALEPYEAYTIGSRVQLCDTDGERFASIIVGDRGYVDAETIADDGIKGHTDYLNLDELLEDLGEYYPDAELTQETCFEIVYWDWEDLWE